jgi:hypothetical protein
MRKSSSAIAQTKKSRNPAKNGRRIRGRIKVGRNEDYSGAKDELKERLEGNNLGGRVVGIETVDNMTDHQIAAKVRQHFAE